MFIGEDPIHIKTESRSDIAELVLMPGDPLRAKFIAENFLDDYKLVNSVRNVYAYTGSYKGKKVTVMATASITAGIFFPLHNVVRPAINTIPAPDRI